MLVEEHYKFNPENTQEYPPDQALAFGAIDVLEAHDKLFDALYEMSDMERESLLLELTKMARKTLIDSVPIESYHY